MGVGGEKWKLRRDIKEMGFGLGFCERGVLAKRATIKPYTTNTVRFSSKLIYWIVAIILDHTIGLFHFEPILKILFDQTIL